VLIDARTLEPDSVLRTQVCVIGGGAAGITVARALADDDSTGGLEVVLVESGGLEPDPDTQALYRGDVVGAPMWAAGAEAQLDEVRLRYLGGTTNHWTGFCRPLEAVDFETRPALRLSGWPFGRAELDPWYDEATKVIRLASPSFDVNWWQAEHDVGAPLLTSDLVEDKLFQVHLGFSWGSAYRDDLDASARIRVLLWANATRLAIDDNSDRVTAVDVRTLSGIAARVEADAFVVALGGVETPRLLLASNDIRPAGLGNGHDVVGRHFAEHLRAQTGHVVLHRHHDEMGLYLGTDIPAPYPGDPDNTISAQAALGLSRRAVTEHELLGCEFQFTVVRHPDPSERTHADGVPLTAIAPLATAVDGRPAPTTAFVQVLAEQELQPASRVRLGSGVDALAMPTVELDWRHTDLDRASIVAAMGLLGRELGRTGTGRLLSLPGGIRYMDDPTPEDFPFLEASAALADPEGFELGVGFHHMCTCRMSTEPATGVVDADCRVHEAANLYLAGSSVFATPGTATPTLTITALALRLADHLRTTMSPR
jgi:choline dehydrogenase-like flavoprotein